MSTSARREKRGPAPRLHIEVPPVRIGPLAAITRTEEIRPEKISIAIRCRGTVTPAAHSRLMRNDDALCPVCKAGFRRIEILSQRGPAGEVRCSLCSALLEVVDGSTEVAYRLTVVPEKMFD